MQEYYIRKEGDEDSRGPFTLEQLSSLVDAGQVDRQTFYYDAISEKWMEVQANPELVAQLFPVKKKLAMRQKESVPVVSTEARAEQKPITVEEMLAAAEGQTEDTRGKRDLSGDEARAARWGMRSMSIILLVSAAGLVVPNMDVLLSSSVWAVLSTPAILLGLVDVLLALLLFLEVSVVYGLVRSRAAVGIGYFLFYLGTISDWRALAAACLGSVALFVCTFLVNIWAVIAVALLGLAGMGGFAYLMLY